MHKYGLLDVYSLCFTLNKKLFPAKSRLKKDIFAKKMTKMSFKISGRGPHLCKKMLLFNLVNHDIICEEQPYEGDYINHPPSE